MRSDDTIILAALEDEQGRVTASQVVNAARDPEHPWHPRFEWDDEAAGEKYRRMQARALIRSIQYERRVERNVVRSVAYVRDPDAEPHTQRYVSVTRLTTDEERARSALVAEFARVGALLRRARALAEMLDMADSVSELVTRVDGMATALRAPVSDGPHAAQ